MIDAAWLTEALRDSGTLRAGRVTAVDVRSTDAFNSSTVFVTATYAGVEPAPPRHLVVKRPSDNAWSRDAAIAEAAFYRYVETQPDHPPVFPVCLAAADDLLVLVDLSATHVEPVNRAQTIAGQGVPSRAALDAAMAGLAAAHRYWWRGHPGPFEVAGWWGDDGLFAEYARQCRAAWAATRSEMPARACPVYDRVLDGLEDWYDIALRPRRAGPLTLLHGDAYLSNMLVPREGSGPAVLLDWQSPTFDIGALDLANLCATFWTREQRRTHEARALRRYHECLAQPDYPYDELWSDYRTAVAFWLLVPVHDAAAGSARTYWWPKMACLLDAYADHDVADLFHR